MLYLIGVLLLVGITLLLTFQGKDELKAPKTYMTKLYNRPKSAGLY